MNQNNSRMTDTNITRNLWNRIKGAITKAEELIAGLDDRVTELEEGGGGEINKIDSISLNGTNVPPDVNKNVALVESDPTVPNWAKQSSKPSYTAREVGALPANTPIPSKTSDLTNDSGFLTSSTGVTGVKGNSENAYRHGNVNLTPANIGAIDNYSQTQSLPIQWMLEKTYPDPESASATRKTYPLFVAHTENGSSVRENVRILVERSNEDIQLFLEVGPGSEAPLGVYIKKHGSGSGWYESGYIVQDKLFLKALGLGNQYGRLPISVAQGGTDATTPAQARANLEITPANIGALPASTTYVSGVKGNSESTYRTGQVNLTPANIGAKPTQTPVSDPTASGNAVSFIDSITQDAQGVVTPTKKTVPEATATAPGLMSATDKTKLDGIESGAQVNSVTGVKGDAEASYRQGNVNLTPANIGAVNKAGDTMTGPLTMDSNLFGALGSTGFRIVGADGALSYLCTADDFYGSGGGWGHFIICNHGNGETYYNYVLRLPFGDSPKYKRQMGGTSAQTPWYDFLTSEKTVTEEQGGTGQTQGTIDITDQCSWHGSFYAKNLIYNPYLKMVFGSFSVIGNVANQAYLVTLPSSVPIVSKGPCGIGTSATSGVSIDVSFEGRNLKSSHSAAVSVSEPRYVIQAYVG